MSDIFKIKGVNISLEIGDKTYPFVDPSFPKKVLLQSEMRAVNEDKALSDADKSLKIYAVNKKMIQLHLSNITDAELDALGQYAMTALLAKIIELSSENFGAVVEKVEEKKS